MPKDWWIENGYSNNGIFKIALIIEIISHFFIISSFGQFIITSVLEEDLKMADKAKTESSH